ncbi:MAG TPA: hypothetical protein VM366_16430 [Anaerolineae bacterium]|nr:hypothetical protein [Anaerolineae bacterium]
MTEPWQRQRLDYGSGGPDEVTLLGCVDGRDVIMGRGRLPPKSQAHDAPIAPRCTSLQLACSGGWARALSSCDGERWFAVGHAVFPLGSNVQCGVYTIGNIDRTVCPGAHSDGTAICFASVQLGGR